jgi:hypothetical protein
VRMRKYQLPRGVYMASGPRPSKRKPYRAMLMRFPDLLHLGSYETPEEAHAAYLSAKQDKAYANASDEENVQNI